MHIWARTGNGVRSAALAGRLLVGAVFIGAGLSKIGNPAATAGGVRAYQILPAALATLWAYGMPTLEILLGILLVVGLASRMSAAITGLLLLAFLGAISAAWARGLSIDCGCFGGGGRVANGAAQYPLDLLRDTGLFALTALVIVWPPGAFAVDSLLHEWPPRPGRRPGWGRLRRNGRPRTQRKAPP
jgi:uncharacterized membrane protein YphA (DoxX/SURF4 family)